MQTKRKQPLSKFFTEWLLSHVIGKCSDYNAAVIKIS